MNRNIARVVLLSAGLIWGFGFVVNKYILDSGWDDSQLLFVRFFTAAIFIFAIFLRRIIKTDKETIKSGLFLGIFLFLGFFPAYALDLMNASASNFSQLFSTDVSTGISTNTATNIIEHL